MYEYKSIENISDYDRIECINETFSDYFVPIHFTEKTFKEYFKLNDITREFSYAAFGNGQMVGAIFNSYSDDYNGNKAVFDVGTRVILEHRGKEVFTGVFLLAEKI